MPCQHLAKGLWLCSKPTLADVKKRAAAKLAEEEAKAAKKRRPSNAEGSGA